jgi:hypothetical protein
VSMLRSIADELVSLFVDDGSLVVLVLIWLTVCWLLLPKLSLPSPCSPSFFSSALWPFSRKALSGEQMSAKEITTFVVVDALASVRQRGPRRARKALSDARQIRAGHCHINRFYCSLLALPLDSDSINSMI